MHTVFCLPVHMFFNLKCISFFKFCDHILMLYLIEIFALPTVNQLKSDFRKHMETSKKICRPKKKQVQTSFYSAPTFPIASPPGWVEKRRHFIRPMHLEFRLKTR